MVNNPSKSNRRTPIRLILRQQPDYIFSASYLGLVYNFESSKLVSNLQELGPDVLKWVFETLGVWNSTCLAVIVCPSNLEDFDLVDNPRHSNKYHTTPSQLKLKRGQYILKSEYTRMIFSSFPAALQGLHDCHWVCYWNCVDNEKCDPSYW